MTKSKFLQAELGPSPLDSGLGFRDWAEDRHLCHIPVGAAILGGAGISGATGLIGGKKGANASTQAANIQAAYGRQALGLQQGVYQQIQSNLQPFLDYGTGGITDATNYLTGAFQQPVDTSLPSFSFPQFTGQPPAPFTFQPTQAQLDNVPGYQYQKQAALDAEQANLTSMGRTGTATAQGAAQTANNVAGANWQNYFNAQLQQYEAGLQGFQTDLSKYTTNFNTASSAYASNINTLLASKNLTLAQKQQVLAGLTNRVGMGLSASSIGSNVGIQASNQLGNTLTSNIGAPLAAGTVGAANANIAGLQNIGQAATTGAGQYAGFQTLNQLYAGQALGAGGNQNFNVDSGLAYMQNPNLMVGGTP